MSFDREFPEKIICDLKWIESGGIPENTFADAMLCIWSIDVALPAQWNGLRVIWLCSDAWIGNAARCIREADMGRLIRRRIAANSARLQSEKPKERFVTNPRLALSHAGARSAARTSRRRDDERLLLFFRLLLTSLTSA
jgi:hypothetical protein